jgi:hypothetical protein
LSLRVIKALRAKVVSKAELVVASKAGDFFKEAVSEAEFKVELVVGYKVGLEVASVAVQVVVVSVVAV